MRRATGVVLSVALFLLCAGLAVPDPPSRRVNDWGGMISPAAEAELEQLLAQHERETSNQVVIATFPSLKGDSLERFSIKLAERWKVGQARKDNGVILLAFRDDRKLRIEVGYGLEGALPDATAGTIIRREISPRFKAGDYDGGFKAGTAAILAAIRGAYAPAPDDAGLPPVTGFDIVWVLVALGFAGIVVAPVYFLWRSLAGGTTLTAESEPTRSRRPKPGRWDSYHRWGAQFRKGPISSYESGGGSSGVYEPKSESWWSRDSSSSWDGGGSSGSGGSGFSGGGGSFGGGGASGGW